MTTSENPDDRQFRQNLRHEMIARRMALSAEQHVRLSTALRTRLADADPWPAGGIIGFCWPVQNEPDILPFIAERLAAGCRVVLPVVVKAGEPLAFREWWPEQALAPDRYGIPTPTDGDFLTPGVLMLPVNAFDSCNFRLGYGGGFFDRTLASLGPCRPKTIGLGFDFQRVASIRPGVHDLPLDIIVTESGCQ